MKRALRRIGLGVLYGIGFGAGFWTLYVPAYLVLERTAYAQYREGRAENVVVVSHEKVERGPTAIAVLGSLENRGRTSVSGIIVGVELYDDGDRFVGQCREYLGGTIPSRATRNYQVICGSEEKPVPEHTRYEVVVME